MNDPRWAVALPPVAPDEVHRVLGVERRAPRVTAGKILDLHRAPGPARATAP